MTRTWLTLTVLAASVAYLDPAGYRWAGVASLALAAALAVLKIRLLFRRRDALRTIAGLRALPPRDFEEEVARWLRRDGWRVEHRGGTGDGGIDIIARHQGETIAVQCKRYAESAAVSAAQVRDLYGAAVAAGASAAVLITTGRVSAPAHAWAEALPEGLVVSLLDAAAIAPVASRQARLSRAWR